jgi:hypothetical protein
VDSLSRLISAEEQAENKMDKVFDSFQGVNAMDIKADPQLWKNAVKGFERVVGPIEQKSAVKLRKLFSSK